LILLDLGTKFRELGWLLNLENAHYGTGAVAVAADVNVKPMIHSVWG